MASSRTEKMPAAMMRPVKIKIKNLNLREKLSNRSSMFHRSVSVLFEAFFEKLRFKRESARDDHSLAFFQSRLDLNAVTELSAKLQLVV